MSPPFASSLADLRVAGYYLPAVSFGYLFTQTQSGGYLWLSALGLLAAVNVHGVQRAFPDPDPSPDSARGHNHGPASSPTPAPVPTPTPTPTPIQLTYAALHGAGNPASYPATLRAAVRNPTLPDGPRRALAVGFVVLAALFVPLVPYSAWVLWSELPLDLMHPTYHLIGQALLFLTATWALQEVGWRFWPAVTVARRPASRDPQDGLEELRTFLTGPGGPEGVTHITYESRAGGYVLIDYVTSATTHDALRAELEDVAIGYLANALNEKYPCNEVSVSVLGDDHAPIGSFTVDGDWADDYADGDITVRDYVERVWDTLEFYRTSGRGLLDADSQPNDELQAGLAPNTDAGSNGHASSSSGSDSASSSGFGSGSDSASSSGFGFDTGSSSGSGVGEPLDVDPAPGFDAHPDASPAAEPASDADVIPDTDGDSEPVPDANETNTSFG